MLTSEAVKAARTRLGESQAEFGRRFGVDQSTVHRWETGGIPDRGAARVALERALADLKSPPTAPDSQRQPAEVER